MYNLSLETSNHFFEKMNLVTQFDARGGYDLLKCKYCGVKGKTRNLTVIEIPENFSEKKVFDCPYSEEYSEKIKKIKITNCTAVGKDFLNLTPGSIHEVIEPPSDKRNSNVSGVWVKGYKGNPVKVLRNEFEVIELN